MLKAKDKFPEQDWESRGLMASPANVREKMNQEVNQLIDFIESRLRDKPSSMKDEIRSYMQDWNSGDLDTEEMEWVVDTMCEAMRIVEVDCNEIMN